MAYYKRLSDHIEELKIDNPRVDSSIKWINIINAGRNELNFLNKNFKFDLVHLKAAAASVSFQRPMIFTGDNYLCLVLHFPTFKGDNIVASEVDFFIGHGYIITVHNNNIKALSDFYSLGKKSPDSLLVYSLESSAILLYEIIGHLMDSCFQLLDDNSLKINEIEELIFNHKQKEAVEKIMSFRRNLINIRKIIQSHKSIFQKLSEMQSTLVERTAIKKYYSVLIEQSKLLWDMLDNQKDTIEVLNNTNESILSGQMADIMKTLTIISVIVFPLTLLAAIFGMNAKQMPIIDHPFGFWIILGLMLLCTLGMLAYFRIRKWL